MAEIVVVACPPWEGELAVLIDPAIDEDPEDRQGQLWDVLPVQRGPDVGAVVGQ